MHRMSKVGFGWWGRISRPFTWLTVVLNVVCTLIDNDVGHHSGQRVVDLGGPAGHSKPLLICFLPQLYQHQIKWLFQCLTTICDTLISEQHHLYSYQQQQICLSDCNITANCGKSQDMLTLIIKTKTSDYFQTHQSYTCLKALSCFLLLLSFIFMDPKDFSPVVVAQVSVASFIFCRNVSVMVVNNVVAYKRLVWGGSFKWSDGVQP